MSEKRTTELLEWANPTTGAAVVPSDVTVLDFKALWVGGGGALVVEMNGVNVTLAAVPAGSWLPIRVQKVLSTGTGATAIVGFS